MCQKHSVSAEQRYYFRKQLCLERRCQVLIKVDSVQGEQRSPRCETAALKFQLLLVLGKMDGEEAIPSDILRSFLIWECPRPL